MARKVKKSKSRKTSSSPVVKSSSDSVDKLAKRLNISRKQLGWALLVAALVGLAFYFKGLFVVATVNGKPISRLEVVKRLEQQSGQEVLDSLVSRSLIMQEAEKRKVSVSQKDIDTEMKKIEKAVSGQGQSFEQVLAAQNLTRKELEDRLKVELLVEKMLKGKVNVTEAEVAEFLTANQETLPEGVSQDELNKSARQQLESQELNTAAQQLLTELKQKAKIRYFVLY